MRDIKIWILGGLVFVMGSVLAWTGAWIAGIVTKKMDEILTALKNLNETLIKHDEKLKSIIHRLDDHEDRIRRFEQRN